MRERADSPRPSHAFRFEELAVRVRADVASGRSGTVVPQFGQLGGKANGDFVFIPPQPDDNVETPREQRHRERIDQLRNAAFLASPVAQIVLTADSASRSFVVKIELPLDTRLRSGLFGRAQFSRGQQQALLIPRSAVVQRGQLQGVFVLDQNKVASLRYVSLGKSSGSEIQVLSGLQSGQWFVANPGERDLNSKHVEGE